MKKAINWEKIFTNCLAKDWIMNSLNPTVRKQPNLKMGKRSEQTPHQRRYIDSK